MKRNNNTKLKLLTSKIRNSLNIKLNNNEALNAHSYRRITTKPPPTIAQAIIEDFHQRRLLLQKGTGLMTTEINIKI